MNRLILILMLLALPAAAQTITTATITVTNTATTNGQTITVNGTVKTWTNSVYTAATDILTNNTAAGALTNLFVHYSSYPVGGGATLSYQSSTSMAIRSFPGQALTVALSAGWGTSVSTTQSLTAASVVRVPYTVEGAAQRTNIASAVSAIIEGVENTNSINQNSFAVSELVGLTNAQTISGNKTMTGTNVLGYIVTGTNGVLQGTILVNPFFTNGANYGNAFRSPGAAASSEQFGSGAVAYSNSSIAIGPSAVASNNQAVAIGLDSLASGVASIGVGNGTIASSSYSSAFGYSAVATAISSTAIGAGATATGFQSTSIGRDAVSSYTNSIALGYATTTTANDQVRLGTASQYVSIPGGLKVDGIITNAVFGNTNSFPAGSDISFGRYAITSLANGNNAGVPIGTNVFVQLSGPSAAFTVCGLANGRNGKLVFLINRTGFDMTIASESGGEPASSATNRIVTMTGADRTTTGDGTATLLYSSSENRWLLINFDP